MSSTSTPQQIISTVLEAVIRHTGLDSLRDRVSDFETALVERMDERSITSLETYLNYFEQSGNRARELNYFTEALTISETYFFRHPEVIDTFRLLLNDSIEVDKYSRVRIWSAACSIGCEPYTLAIILRELGQKYPYLNYEICATDINAKSLESAKAARFSKWALRNMSVEKTQRYFRQSGNEYVLRPLYRDGVSFELHNLMEGPPKSVVQAGAELDAIFCRNVLIYFNFETTVRMIRMFYDLLRPGGWLVLGPSESNSLIVSGFEVIQGEHSVIYRKPSGRLAKRLNEPYAPMEIRPLYKTKPMRGVSLKQKPIVDVLPPFSDSSRVGINGMIRDRLLAKAYEELLKQIELNDLDSHLLLLAGFVAQESGLVSEAEPHYRKAIYLDRKSAVAHYLYGLLLMGKKLPTRALKEYEVALKLLHAEDVDSIQLPTETISRKALIERIQNLTRSLDESN